MPSRRVASRRGRATVGTRVAACLLAGALLAAACSDDDAAPTSTTPATTATPTTERVDDGVFRVAAVIPDGGAAPDLGVSMRAALEMAKVEINSNGGVRGQQIGLVVRDEGDNPASAMAAVKGLIDDGYDAIIGPTSSINVASTLPTTVKAGVLTCSPTASAMSLDSYPDDNLFFRTVPSDSLQAKGIAKVVTDTGRRKAVIAYLDDGYGRPFEAAVAAAMEDLGTTPTAFAFPPGKVPPVDVVARIVDALPEVVVVIADSTTGPAIITAVDAAIEAAAGPRTVDDDERTQYVVNDALRRPDATATAFGPDLAVRIKGVAPRAYASPNATAFHDAFVAEAPTAGGLYAVNAYDCLMLMALGAESADSFSGPAIHGALQELTETGTACAGYAACLKAVRDGLNVNYNGPSGSLSLDSKGNQIATTFDVFTFDPETGRDIVKQSLPIGVE